MQHRDQEVLIDVSTAAMDTGGYGVLLTVTAEGGTEVDAAFSHLGNCASLDEARDRAEIFAQNWVEENIFRQAHPRLKEAERLYRSVCA